MRAHTYACVHTVINMYISGKNRGPKEIGTLLRTSYVLFGSKSPSRYVVVTWLASKSSLFHDKPWDIISEWLPWVMWFKLSMTGGVSKPRLRLIAVESPGCTRLE